MEELEMTLLEAEEKMDKSIASYQYELNTVRTGRANASLLDSISIDYYGVPTPVKQVSSISVPEASQLYIKPYDKSSIQEIEKAVNEAKSNSRPTVIVAKTVKGKGVSFMENQVGWHGKAPSKEEFEIAMKELQ